MPAGATVYLDYNATTPLDPRVCDAVAECLCATFGNASILDHRLGWDAADAIEEARDLIREGVHSASYRAVFTSGATEALNTVIQGYLRSESHPPSKIVACASEHEAVLEPCRHYTRRCGVAFQVLPVDELGRVDVDQLRQAISASVRPLVAVMAANNEIGTVHPIATIARVVHEAEGLLLCDTTQIWGKFDFGLDKCEVDFATVSAHKLYGPKGVGVLLIRDTIPKEHLEPLIMGGGQEQGQRGGTINVAGVVGLGQACRLIPEHLSDVERIEGLRDRLERAILSQTPGTWVNGDLLHRLPNTTNIGFRGVEARTLIRAMHDVAVSTRSACSSGRNEPSHVLKGIGLSDEDACSCIRFSLGRFTTEDEVDYVTGKVVRSAHHLRRSALG